MNFYELHALFVLALIYLGCSIYVITRSNDWVLQLFSYLLLTCSVACVVAGLITIYELRGLIQ
jgi:hypothetical protein